MNDRQIDQYIEIKMLNEIGFLDPEEFESYICLKGIRLAVIVI